VSVWLVPIISVIGVGGLAALLYAIVRAIIDKQIDLGGAQERANQARAEAERAQKQGEIIAEHKTRDDAARDLDNGDF
jgi:hypothetical protein